MQVLDSPSLDIVTLLPEDEGMAQPIRERLDGIEERLVEIETALGLKPPKPKSAFTRFREHLWQQIKTHSRTIIPIAAIVVGVSGWFISGWFKYYLDHKYDFIDGMITTNLSAKGGVKDTLTGVQQTVTKIDATLTTLAPFIQDVIRHQFESASNLPTAILQKRLPAIQHLVSTAKDQGIKTDAKVLAALTQKVSRADANAPGFWQTAAVLISYRSSLLVGSLQNWSRAFSPCSGPLDLDSLPNPTVRGVGPDGKPTGLESTISRIGDQDCYIELDSKKISRWDCTRCLVKYSGGPLSMRDVHFVDCLFVFDFSGQPTSADGSRLSRTLLTSELKDVTIPAV